MTREEATQIMSTWLVSSKGAKGQRGYIEGWFDEEDAEAFRMAIEALQNEETLKTQLANCHREILRLLDFSDMTESPDDDIEPQNDVTEVVRKPIKGYEDYYEVDQFGRVFAKERTTHVKDHDREYDKHLPSRQMKQSVHTKGYKIVPLTKDGVCTTKFVHRLVAEAFIPNPDDLPFVNHIDEDKTNNFVENLEWCTEQYNSTYGKAREKHAKALKGRHHTEEHKKKISDSLKRFYGERREP